MTTIVLLFLANVATLTIFWLGRPKKNDLPPQRKQAADYIIKEAGFDKNQEEQYRQLIKEHQEKADLLRNEIRKAKDRFFELIKQENVSDSLKTALANDASSKTAALDLLTMEHFEKIKAICRPDQLDKFEKIISEAVHMMGPGQGGPVRPGQGGPGDRRGPPPGGQDGERGNERPPPPEKP